MSLGLAAAFLAPDPGHRQVIEWLEEPRAVNEFRLESSGNLFDNSSLQGRWTIISFGFLNCPDICPTSLSQIAAVSGRISPYSSVAFVFVSVDPGRDSASAVNRYARQFDATFNGVTGNEAELSRLADSLGIQFKVAPDPDASRYTVAHSITYSVINPAGELQGRFRPGFDADSFVLEFSKQVSSPRI